MRTVQQEGVSPLPTSDTARFPCKLAKTDTYAAQHQITKLSTVLLIDRMESVDITDERIESGALALNIKPFYIANEVVEIKKPREFVAFCMTDQVSVLRKLNSLPS